MRIGYLRQYTKLFGLYYGIRMYVRFTFKQYDRVKIPKIDGELLIRNNDCDLRIFHQIFVNHEYRIDIPFQPKTIVDAGANIGLFSVYMKSRYPECKIVALEPDHENFTTAKKNLEAYEGIQLFQKGVWPRKTFLAISDKFNSGKWAMVVEENEKEGSIETITIPDILLLLENESIDILKLDIETSEKQLFMSNYSDWLPKIKMIIIEFHDFMEPDTSRPFFIAINECIKSYSISCSGENIVILNNDILQA